MRARDIIGILAGVTSAVSVGILIVTAPSPWYSLPLMFLSIACVILVQVSKDISKTANR